jgi:alpha-L-rhamnosidase
VRRGEERVVKRVDRRTFLANSLRTGVAVVAAGSIAYEEWTVSQPVSGASRSPGKGLRGQPSALSINGDSAPVGVDPDDTSFAWELGDPAKGALQRAYRITLSRGGKQIWDSGEVSSNRQAFVSYKGPALASDTAHDFTVTTRNAKGVWSPTSQAASFITGLRENDWSAVWLRPGPADTGLEQYTYLRKTFDLPSGTISHAVVYTAAAHKYQLWLNGQKHATGPSFCYPDEQYVQGTDVSEIVATGARNTLGFLHHWYSAGKGRPASAPGLLAQLSVRYTDGRHVTVGTDRTWKQQRAEWLLAPQRNTDAGDFVEIIDGRASPSGWAESSFDDSAWSPAPVLGPVGTEPFTELFIQRTRITELDIAAASVTTLDGGAVVVDFGKIYAARPTVEFRDGIAGRMISMHVGYVLDPDGHVSTTNATQATNLALYYIQSDGRQTFEPYTYLGFRYLEIDAPGETIGHDQVSAIARHCTLPDVKPASFSSSDETLDAVWALCSRSGQFVTHEQFVDTPTREKGQFLWDACSESQVVMRVFRDQNLSKQALRDFARSQKRFWPDGRVSDIYPTGYGAQSYVSFTALYPEWVWRYYLSTGDLDEITTLYPTLVRLADYLSKGVSAGSGLVTGLPLAPSADNNYGYDFDTAADTTINILSSNAFKRVSQIATEVGDASGAATQLARAESVARKINHWLVNSDGLYVDGLRSNYHRSSHASQEANSRALAYGIVPPARAEAVGRYVASLGISVEPDQGMELLRALHAAGFDADVVSTLTDASRPGWAWILTHGGTFCWEAWELNNLIGDSMSHGWGSSALVAMQEVLLGVVPAVPAAGEPPTVLEISPAFSVLDRASGIVPTVAGTAQVGWSRAGSELSVALTLPPNSLAKVSLPARSVSDVTADSVAVEHAEGIKVSSSGQGRVNLQIGAGRYALRISQT